MQQTKLSLDDFFKYLGPAKQGESHPAESVLKEAMTKGSPSFVVQKDSNGNIRQVPIFLYLTALRFNDEPFAHQLLWVERDNSIYNAPSVNEAAYGDAVDDSMCLDQVVEFYVGAPPELEFPNWKTCITLKTHDMTLCCNMVVCVLRIRNRLFIISLLLDAI